MKKFNIQFISARYYEISSVRAILIQAFTTINQIYCDLERARGQTALNILRILKDGHTGQTIDANLLIEGLWHNPPLVPSRKPKDSEVQPLLSMDGLLVAAWQPDFGSSLIYVCIHNARTAINGKALESAYEKPLWQSMLVRRPPLKAGPPSVFCAVKQNLGCF